MAKQNFTNRIINNDNYYIQNALHIWRIDHSTYCLLTNSGQADTYLVRVLSANEEIESYWLDEGQLPYETESGAAWAILNSLSHDS